LSQFLAETRKALAAGVAAAVTVLVSSGNLSAQTIAGAAGAFVAAALLVYLVPNAAKVAAKPAA
jgi:membrane carboxypeptidase/penicillin-binding protein PbpC